MNPSGRWRLICGWCIATMLATPLLPADQIQCQQQWSNVFGQSSVRLDFHVHSEKQTKAVVRWVHWANERRVISRGETQLELHAHRVQSVPVHLRIPAVKDGIVWPTTLSISVTHSGDTKAIAVLEKTLWVFGRDPWVQRRSALESHRIVLLDRRGTTAEVFARHRIPHTHVKRAAVVESLASRMIVVGAGETLDESLSHVLVSGARRGANVLILAPLHGAVTVANVPDLPVIRLSLQRHSVIADLDKRLDAVAWQGAEGVPVSWISPRLTPQTMTWEFNDPNASWAWVAMEFGKTQQTRSQLVICGFQLLKHWDTSPTPRYLFDRILQSFEVSRDSRTES